MLDQHPHAAAVLGAALEGEPAHAYLLHGPAGSGKRDAARDFAAGLLARGAGDPDVGAHCGCSTARIPTSPGSRRAARTRCCGATSTRRSSPPPRARRSRRTHRVFVLERADTMNDEAANSLLKTLEEPPPYVVLLLLTDRPTQVLPTISSRCQPVRFDPPPPTALAQRLQSQGVDARRGDRVRAAVARRRRAGAHARPATGRAARPRRGVRPRAAGRPRPRRARLEAAARPGPRRRRRGQGGGRGGARRGALVPAQEGAPRRETEFTERARRAERRASTGALDHALQLVGLWYRDLACVVAGADELVHHSDRIDALREDAEGRDRAALLAKVELVDDTRARLALNVSEELALEALAYRLES